MTTPKLVYFPVYGKGEPFRMICSLVGLEY